MSRYNLLALIVLAGICTASAQLNPPTEKCASNESFSQCGNMCEPSCDNPNPLSNMLCQIVVCFRPITGGCRCNSNLVRNGRGGSCIPRGECK
ncbi:chymotrypsin inhibitor-like [Halictus rubicundus]|uniref:chymotrypsin inhibitor-like n=1 Tax=Halictus rubicundus TaxID=77578 RepID=UPI00403658AD